MSGIARVLRRKDTIVAAHPDRHTGLRGAADQLSRRLADAAVVELLTEALHRLTVLAYEQDAAGWVNVDRATGRLLIPAPWGRAGRARWGLYPSEGDTLRSILRARMRSNGSPLYVYDRSRRSWFVNLGGYPDRLSALAYLKERPITVEEYRLHRRKVMGR